MKRIYFLAAIAALFLPSASRAQFALTNGDHTLEIGGNMIGGYEYQFYPKGTTDLHNHTFVLDQARFNLRGRIGNELQYKFEIDFADLAADIQTPGPILDFLKDAYLEYKNPFANVKVGFQKVPSTFSSLMEEIDEPFLKRPYLVTRMNSRRDVGVTLIHEFPIQGLNLYGGLYSGMGEEVFSTNNTTGKPEYAGRIEYAFPSKYQREKVDWRISPVPIFQVGLSTRYDQNSISTGEDGFNFLTVNGKKSVYSADASVFYKGFTLFGEITQDHVMPLDSTILYSEGKQYSYFNAGGYVLELDYYAKCLKSLIGVRYDQVDPSDLVYGNTQRTVAFCYNYMIKQNFLEIKAEYDDHLNTSYQNISWKNNELFLELQLIFN